MSGSRSLEFFLSSIQDPHNPRHCGQCLDGAFRECTDVDVDDSPEATTASTNKPQKCNPDLWNAIVNLLFIKRSKKQMARFLTLLTECNCKMDQQGGDVRRYHQRSVFENFRKSQQRKYNDLEHEREEHRYIRAWRPFLFNLVYSLEFLISSSSKRLSAKGSSTSWPINLTDMVPYGPDAFVLSILQWYQTIPDPLFIYLMSSLLHLSRELVIPSLAKFKFTKTVVESTRQLLDRIIEDHLSGNKPEHLDYLIYRFPWHVSDAASYLGFVIFNKTYKTALHQDFETKAMQLLSLTLYVADAIRSTTTYGSAVWAKVETSRLAILGEQLFRLYAMDQSPEHTFPVHPMIKHTPSELQFMPHVDDATPLAHPTVLNSLINFRLDMRCSAVGCMNSLQTSGKNFQRCGKCDIAAYCGRECQKKAWKDEEPSHKHVCPLIVDLVRKAGGSALFAELSRLRHSNDNKETAFQIMDTMKRNWRNSHVDDKALMVIVMWAFLIENGRGCHDLSAQFGATAQVGETTPVEATAQIGATTQVGATAQGQAMQLQKKALSPGFPDYGTVIIRLSRMKGVPKPVYLDPCESPLAELAESVEKEMAELKTIFDSLGLE